MLHHFEMQRREARVETLRNALARHHGGEVIPEEAAKGESQSNGTVEQVGKVIREYVQVYKEHIEDKTGIKLMSPQSHIRTNSRSQSDLCTRLHEGGACVGTSSCGRSKMCSRDSMAAMTGCTEAPARSTTAAEVGRAAVSTFKCSGPLATRLS